MEQGQARGMDDLAAFKDQLEQNAQQQQTQAEEETYNKFKEVYQEVTKGRPECIPSVTLPAAPYMEKFNIGQVQFIGIEKQSEGNDNRLLINVWPADDENITIHFTVDPAGNISELRGGKFNEVEKAFKSLGLTKNELAFEMLRFAEQQGISFFRKSNAEIFPNTEEFPKGVESAGPGVPSETREDLERIPFLIKLNGSLFGIAPENKGLEDYCGVIFPGGLIIDCHIVPNAVYGVRVESPEWRERLEKIRNQEDQDKFIAEMTDPLITNIFTSKKEAQDHPDVTWHPHNTKGTWKDRVMLLAESYQ